MKFNGILKQCCMFCSCFDPDARKCGDRKAIQNPILYSCSFFTVSDNFDTLEDVEVAIMKHYSKSFEELDPWKENR